MIRLTALLCLTLMAAMPVYAQEKATPAPEAAAAAKTEAAKPAPAPVSAEERLDAKAEEMMKGLDQNQIMQFRAIRTAHGTIRAVEDVRDSLERAVKSCGTANPDMIEAMSARYQSWKNEVLPIVRQGQNRLDKMILSQGFARPSAVRAYLKNFDDMIKQQKSGYTEVPVSSKESCQSLEKNMDSSQRVMGRLIIETLGLDKELKTTTE